MQPKIINGKQIAEKIKQNIKQEVEKLEPKPGLAVILVGDDPASIVYTNEKEKTCRELGIFSKKFKFKKDVSQEKILNAIEKLNSDKSIHGILVQLPLPEHLDKNKIISAISPDKDVDGLHPVNLEKLEKVDEAVAPCTPKGIIRLLEEENIELKDKNIVLVGYGVLVGKPLHQMLLNRNAQVDVCDEFTQDLKAHTLKAEILIVATGAPNLIKQDMVKEGVVIIDAGTTKVEDKLVGDVDFENVKNKCSYITPVPGGVGPMTVTMLMENVLILYKKQYEK